MVVLTVFFFLYFFFDKIVDVNFGNLIIYDRSDDEDYVMMEAENSDLEYQHPRGGRHNSREHVLLKDWQFQF